MKLDPRTIVMLVLSGLRVAVAATPTPADDAVLAIAEEFVATVTRREKFSAWTVVDVFMQAAQLYASRTSRTADDKLVAEFQRVAAALEGVIGEEVWRAQLKNVIDQMDWPFLDAPGVPRA